MSNPTISFANSLDVSVTVYDSFSEQDKSNYFGTLTLLATVPASSTAPVQLTHSTSVLIVSNAATNVPLARLIYSPLLTTSTFAVGQADVNAMAQTTDFIAFITKNKTDPLTMVFRSLMRDSSKPQVTSVNQFFAKHPPYTSCTLATYMMAITYAAEQPQSKGQPMDQAVYSLSTVVTLLGRTWPSDFPDIVLTKFTCNTENDILAILAEIDLDKLPAQSDAALKFFGSLFNVKKLRVAVSFNYSFSSGVLGTRLSISLDAMRVPFGDSATLTINKPTVTIDINPLFKFVVFTVKGSIPFSILGKNFDADVSMLIDNIEANFGAVIKDDNTSLPAPPVMQGVHFDSFGVGIGIIFEPPSAAIGVSGQFHIGDSANNAVVNLDDSTFVVVCQLLEEVPNPLYISFYIPELHLTDVLTIFTNAKTSLDVPVSFTDLSFKWSKNPLVPVALPDGTLSKMGYGFSAAAHIFSFSFYGDIEVDLNSGLKANIEMSPLSLSSIFSIGGDGTGVSIKVDANGNPIKNNQIATTAEKQQALKTATTKELVLKGGPVLHLSTSASPFLHLSISVSLFELENEQLTADVTSSGIQFNLDFSGVLTSMMSCTLSDWHNLAASFEFGIDKWISLPTTYGLSLGSIHLVASVSAHFSLQISSSDIIFSIGGNFNFEGIAFPFGDFTADMHIQKVSDMISAIISNIEDDAKRVFGPLLNEVKEWASNVWQGVITGIESVGKVLKNVFGLEINQIATTMKDAGFDLGTITGDIKQIFDPGQVADTLSNVFNLSGQDVAKAMAQVGYAGEDVARAIQGILGHDAGQIASALQVVFGWGPDQVKGVLDAMGFPAEVIGQAFQSLGDDFSKAGQDILDVFNPFG